MADIIPSRKESFEALMRGAGTRRREIAARAIEAERIVGQSRKNRQGRPRVDLALRLELEIESLEAVLEFTADVEERVFLRAEIAYLRKALEAKRGTGRRKPPESGVPVPAVPPNGPTPKQGGAAAPLEFDS